MSKCTFCEIAAGQMPAAKVFENDHVVAFFDINPVAEYHTLVIPKRHATDIFDVSNSDAIAVMSAIKHITQSFKDTIGIQSVQILSSNGAAAQQDVFHLHFHIVPRTAGDNLDIKWVTNPSIVERFDKLLSKIKR